MRLNSLYFSRPRLHVVHGVLWRPCSAVLCPHIPSDVLCHHSVDKTVVCASVWRPTPRCVGQPHTEGVTSHVFALAVFVLSRMCV